MNANKTRMSSIERLSAALGSHFVLLLLHCGAVTVLPSGEYQYIAMGVKNWGKNRGRYHHPTTSKM